MELGYVEWLNIIMLSSLLLNAWVFSGWLERRLRFPQTNRKRGEK